jgi:predicted esterase
MSEILGLHHVTAIASDPQKNTMVPFSPDLIRDYSHISVFIGAGRLDPIVPSGQVEELGAIFESGRADVTISWHQAGHELGEDDIRAAKTWLSKEKVRKKVAA